MRFSKPNTPQRTFTVSSINMNRCFLLCVCESHFFAPPRWTRGSNSKRMTSIQHTSVISSGSSSETVFPPLIKPSSFDKEWAAVFPIVSCSDIFLYLPTFRCLYVAERSSLQDIPFWKCQAKRIYESYYGVNVAFKKKNSPSPLKSCGALLELILMRPKLRRPINFSLISLILIMFMSGASP